MPKAAAKKNKIRLPSWAKWALGYAGVLLFAVGLVYAWRVMFELPSGTGVGLRLTLIAAGVGTVLYVALWAIHRFLAKNPCLQAAACVFVLGLLFCYATAPLQAPDEDRHFLRAYAVSMGRLDYDYSRGYPNDVNLLLEKFPNAMNHSVKYERGELATRRMQDYQNALDSDTQAAGSQPETVQFMVGPYVPQALGMLAARLFGFSALGQMYVARIANLLCYAALCYLAFKNCDKYRGVFYAAAMLPLSLFMAASCSVDGLMLGFCYLIISYFCKAEIYNRDVILFVVAVAAVTVLKPNNIVLAAVLLLIPESRWKSKYKPWLTVGVLAAGALLLYFGAGFLNGLRTHNYPASLGRGVGDGANPTQQIWFVLRNPFAFVPRMLLTFYEQAGFLFDMGNFGWTDLSIPLVSGLSVLSLAAASSLGIQQKEDTKTTGAVALGLAAVFYSAAVMLGLYITHTDVSSIRITGLQPRYFLPAFLMLFMLASILLGKAVRPRLATGEANTQRTEQITLWIVVCVAVVSAVLLAQNYFIGQWIPRASGDGYKMVNLLGWKYP